ncbi:hypothetical protein MRX96_018353 [Rhipicephalus microplus]
MTSKQIAPADMDANNSSPQYGPTTRSSGAGGALRCSTLASPSLEQVLEQLQREQKRDGRRVLVGFVLMTLSIGFVVLVVLARLLLDETPGGRRPPLLRARWAANPGRRSMSENDSDAEAVGRGRRAPDRGPCSAGTAPDCDEGAWTPHHARFHVYTFDIV